MDRITWICFVWFLVGSTRSCNPSQRLQRHPQEQYCNSQFVIRAKILKKTSLYEYMVRHCLENDTPKSADDMWTKTDQSGNIYLDSRAKSCPLSKKYIQKFLNNIKELGLEIDKNKQETTDEDSVLSDVFTIEEDEKNIPESKLLDRVFYKFGKYGKNGPSVHLARIIYIYKGNDILTTSKLVEIFSTDHSFDENSIYVLSGDIDGHLVPDTKYANVIRTKMFEGRLNVLNEHWAVKYPEITRQQFRGLKGIFANNCNCKVYECEDTNECNHRLKKTKNIKKKNKHKKSKLRTIQIKGANQTDTLSTQCEWVPSDNTCAYFFGSCVYTETDGCVWKRPHAFKSCERMFGRV